MNKEITHVHGMKVAYYMDSLYTPRRRTFAILHRPGKFSDFVIEELKRDGTAKHNQPRELYDRVFDYAYQASQAVGEYLETHR